MLSKKVSRNLVLAVGSMIAMTWTSTALAIPFALVTSEKDATDARPSNRVSLVGAKYVNFQQGTPRRGSAVGGQFDIGFAKKLSFGGVFLDAGGDDPGEIADLHLTFHLTDGWALQVLSPLSNRRAFTQTVLGGTTTDATFIARGDGLGVSLIKAFQFSERLSIQYAASLVNEETRFTQVFRAAGFGGGVNQFVSSVHDRDTSIYHTVTFGVAVPRYQGLTIQGGFVLNPDIGADGRNYFAGAGYAW